ncbi:hypothetical protein COV06_00625 [Candidatus Uhrbacteria bacterium CG10_big_fil_rev_8_21_14_0_10_50_16]|uniref:Vitamin K epoxide reductase domain-containing protein n=1 Tax=Candidatus Uhrbacteria bacterium CG10_big_fil_rev_8_21_14_0_10_50_16 TaxID=1975039 RepID=A0A2H0RMV9_9BACT|nr:MAG: hypothetical protein COV06_00625 [Candidatus Uhrbacteria bacterium CG10_big_fil_rev_8_21_14_0_10_50_16]
MGIYLTILLLAACGFSISFYIRYTKTKARPLVCPLKGNCHAVTGSSFSKFLGIPVEFLGMLYYGILVAGYGVALTIPPGVNRVTSTLLILTTIGFLFSLYLTFIQVITLRKFCTWCLISAAITTTSFFLALFTGTSVAIPYLQLLFPIFSILSYVSLGVCIGGATISFALFFQFLRDFRISNDEAESLKNIFELIWMGFVILLVSNAAIFLAFTSTYNQDPIFITKGATFIVLLISGWFLNFHIAPRLFDISFRNNQKQKLSTFRSLRRWAFTVGSAWIVSWYAVLLLTIAPAVIVDLWELLTYYLALLLVGGIVSQFIEQHYAK